MSRDGSEITWHNTTVRLGDWEPWGDNPRDIDDQERERLAASLREFGQVETLAIGPRQRDGKYPVYNGHQRLKVLMALHDANYEVDARVSSRPLTRRERKRLVGLLHAAAVGHWDWGKLREWGPDELIADGFDDALLAKLERDTEGLMALLDDGFGGGEEPPDDPGAQSDRADELREKWGTEVGQLWRVMGASEHVVYCADSAALEWPDGIDIIVTDPPYDLDVDIVRAIFDRVGALTAIVLTGGEQGFILANSQWRYSLDFVWRTRRPRSFPTPWQPNWYHHNVVILARGGGVRWQRPENAWPSVFETESEFADGDFGHAKAPDVFWWMLRGFVGRVRRVADPFLGAGGSLLACERLGLGCVGAEIEPRTLAVALERFAGAGLNVERI